MGLLDSIAGQVLNASGGAGNHHAGLVEAIGGLIQQHPGGLSGLVASFEQGGLGGLVASWVGTGANLPISAEQLQSVLGSDQVQAIAARLGISPEQASGHLAQVLPQVVDKLTPDGTVPAGANLGDLLGMLQR
jgi:uncharacterized protein YidB (DUF937 family)